MKASELIEILKRHPDDEIVLLLDSPSIGPRASIPIASACSGFDWEKGQLLLSPETSVVKKTDSESIFDMARDLIMWLATKPVKKASYEVDMARRILNRKKVDFMKYQNLFHKTKK
jgi:hypothetical protein